MCAQKQIVRASLAIAGILYASASPGAPEAHAFRTISDVIEQSGALIEGDVSDISYSYDSTLGPRTHVQLKNVVTRLGTFSGKTFDLNMFGGPLPNGNIADVTGSNRYYVGGHYLIFLLNTEWFYSPVANAYSFHVEVINGKELLLDDIGAPLLGLSQRGVTSLSLQVTEPTGQDSKAPFKKPGVLPGAAGASLAGATSIAAFVAGVQSLALGNPKAFLAPVTMSPRNRVWNIDIAVPPMNVSPSPADGGAP